MQLEPLQVQVVRLNTIGDPLLYAVMLAGLIGQHGRARVRQALIDEADKMGVISIAASEGWCERARPRSKAG